ncbi:MAG: hypothetical protein RIR94_1967 [Bacteroidota bacterium]|jgi:dTDP-4-dehydrorhamnose reductase
MIIAVIGGTGLLGAKCVQYFLAQGYEVVNVSRRIHPIQHEKLSNLLIDLTDKSTWSAIEKLKVGTHVIHTAALTDLKYCEENSLEAWTTHVAFSRYLEKIVSGSYIYISTVGVYNNLNDTNTLGRRIEPASWYAKTKYFGEPSSSRNYILRLNIIGIENKEGKSLMEWAYKQFLNGHKIKGYEDFYINPVSTDFVAQICELLLVEHKFNFGVYDLGSKEIISKFELLKKLAQKMGCPQLVEPARANENSEIFHITEPSPGFMQDWNFDLNLI